MKAMSKVRLMGTNIKLYLNELINFHSYDTEKILYEAIEEFAYTTYNHVRPQSYNGYKTPFEASVLHHSHFAKKLV